jgi:hypothetical protein
MPFNLSFNQQNLVTSRYKNTYTYNLPISATFRAGDKVALSTLNMYYSWGNISNSYENNEFSYVWPVGSVTVDITLPNGYYTIAEINAYLQNIMVQNNHYLIDSTGEYVYYLEIVTNATLYSVQLNSYPIPTSSPAGWSAPGGWTGYPVSASTPQFVIPATNIRNVFGINAGTYPAAVQATPYSKTSDFTPQVSPVSRVFLTCSLLNNTLSRPVNLLYNFSPSGTEYGAQISIMVPYLVYTDIQSGTYSSISISFVDQDFNALPIQDSNLTVQLTIKRKNED